MQWKEGSKMSASFVPIVTPSDLLCSLMSRFEGEERDRKDPSLFRRWKAGGERGWKAGGEKEWKAGGEREERNHHRL